MIRGEQSAAVLIQAAKLAFVRAAISRMELGGARVNVSRLAVVTGLTRKEVASLMPHNPEAFSSAVQKRSMEHRALRVLRGWTSDPLYRTPLGEMIDLPIAGSERSFASLVRSYGGDVTTMAVLREFERLKLIVRTRSGKLRPRSRSARSNLLGSTQYKEFSRVLDAFSKAAAQMLGEAEASPFYGYRQLRVRSDSEAASFKGVFARRAAHLLESVEHWDSRQSTNRRRETGARNGSTQHVGLGVYLIHAGASAETRKPANSR
jgi:hypothetical protein